jgi:hypothetical protein
MQQATFSFIPQRLTGRVGVLNVRVKEIILAGAFKMFSGNATISK